MLFEKKNIKIICSKYVVTVNEKNILHISY